MGAEKDLALQKAEKQAKRKKSKVTFEGFFTVNLDEGNKSDLAGLVEEGYDVGKLVDDIVSQGYKVSVVSSVSGAGAMCAVYGSRTDSPDAGWGFSSWADGSSAAILVAHYKLSVVIAERTFLEYMDENPVSNGKVGFS